LPKPVLVPPRTAWGGKYDALPIPDERLPQGLVRPAHVFHAKTNDDSHD
jgi:hypothetical protein